MAPFLTELHTGKIPAPIFFQPITFLLLIITYGLPVLIIREVSVRLNFKIVPIITLGLAYGILNEGIFAKTLLFKTHATIPTFDNYGYLWGINFSWTVIVLLFHACHSVLYPILIVHFFYPNSSPGPWISKRWTALITLPVIYLGFLFFFNNYSGSIFYLLFFIATIVILFSIAYFLPYDKKDDGQKTKFSLQPVFWGFAFAFFYIGSFILSGMKVNLFFFFIYCTLVLFGTSTLLKKKNWFTLSSLLLFGLGDYMAFSLFSAISGKVVLVVTAIVFEIIFVRAIIEVKKLSLASG
jgi:hypothetical protein